MDDGSHAHRIAAPTGKESTWRETVSWDGLRELAEFRAEKGCAISFYLDLDPRTDADARRRRHADKLPARPRRAPRGDEQPRADPRPAARAQGRLRPDPRLLRRTSSSGTGRTALAIFSAGLDNVWRPRALIESVPDESGRPGVLPRAARPARRPRRRRDRRRRRPRARPALPAAARAAGGDRRPHRRRSRPSRPGRLVAGPLPAPHREARRGAPERGGRGARPAGAQRCARRR